MLSAGAACAASFDLRTEAGLRYETSEFPVVKIGDAPAIVVPGERERHSDWFRSVVVNGAASQPLGHGFGLLGNANFDSRTGATSNEFDTQISHADGGVQYTRGTTTFMTRALAEYWKVGGQPYRHVRGGTLDIVSALSKRHSALVSFEAVRYDYSGDNAVLDADRRSVTGNLRFGDVTPLQGSITVQATFASEHNREGDPSLDLKSQLYRLAWDGRLSERWKAQIAFIGQKVRYGDVDPVLGVRRDDRYGSVDASLSRRLASRVSLVFDVAYAGYRSTSDVLYNNWRSTGVSLEIAF